MKIRRAGFNKKEYKIKGSGEQNFLIQYSPWIHDDYAPLNEFFWKRIISIDDGHFSMLDFKNAKYTEYFNQSFKPFKKR